MSKKTAIVWFRNDLRLDDNPALNAAARRYDTLVCVYIFSPEDEGGWVVGQASRWWLYHSLAALEERLRQKGSRLILRLGSAADQLRELVRETAAQGVYWNHLYEPLLWRRDAKLKRQLEFDGIDVQTFNGSLLFAPWEVTTKQDRPYQIFTPFWKACRDHDVGRKPTAEPRRISAPRSFSQSLSLVDLKLLPEYGWADKFEAHWQPGEEGAKKRLRRFASRAIQYSEQRDRPDLEGVSRLSGHLHFGEISPLQIYHVLQRRRNKADNVGMKSIDVYLSEIGWREFAYHLLYHFPHTTDRALRAPFRKFPWRNNAKHLKAWRQGRTGYPVVDAAMRELWETGWMHNRMRMVAASFLTKHLLIRWQAGAKWFWDTLVDADLANNTLGWQWTAGCGADAAPYYRIFNPVTQGRKFDPDGIYVRRWAPELARLPVKYLFCPWEAPAEVLKAAGVVLGQTYPHPIIDHAEAHRRALNAYEVVRP